MSHIHAAPCESLPARTALLCMFVYAPSLFQSCLNAFDELFPLCSFLSRIKAWWGLFKAVLLKCPAEVAALYSSYISCRELLGTTSQEGRDLLVTWGNFTEVSVKSRYWRRNIAKSCEIKKQPTQVDCGAHPAFSHWISYLILFSEERTNVTDDSRKIWLFDIWKGYANIFLVCEPTL